jgi:hypothetical protein
MFRFGMWILCLCVIVAAPASAADDDGFKSLFNGKNLTGWSSPKMDYWSVQDGAITGQSKEKLNDNQFLVWQLGHVDDFELKCLFKIEGTDNANSGIQIRSQVEPDGHVVGYQADLIRSGKYAGMLYDEKGRGVLAKKGTVGEVPADGGKPTFISLKPSTDDWFKKDEWNEYHITATGNQIVLKINKHVTAIMIDHDKKNRDFSGVLALQLHAGEPMRVLFKDIRLKRLPLTDNRKKIVMIAGAPSHASGQHEFNAGLSILGKRLAKLETVVAAKYNDKGWPKDPTAFDNANAVVFYADGLGRHPLQKHFEQMDTLIDKGVGVMCMHFAVHVEPGKSGTYFQKWMGGFYETGWSSNPHWDAKLTLNKKHPVLNGVKSGIVHDEWYFNMRFRDGEKGVTSLLEAKPNEKARSKNGYPPKPYPHIIAAAGRSEKLMWAVERKDGGRGVGFTGGHWHRNWAHPTQRKAILNAMVWVAGANVPEGGIESVEVTEEELNQNLDPKKKINKIQLPEIK